MKRLVILILASSVVAACGKMAIAPPPASPPAGPPKLIWAGTSGGFSIRWTAGDISASPVLGPSRQALSELGLTIFDFHSITRKQTSDCDFVRVTQLQSVVGSIVSIMDTDTMKCASGATGTGRKTVAIDLRHPGTPALLTDYFPVHELDSLVTRANLLCHSKPEHLFNRFAFSELHGNAVVVAVTLPPDCPTSSVSLALNVPTKLSLPLQLAASRKQGFLLKDQPMISGGQTTTINYHYRTTGS